MKVVAFLPVKESSTRVTNKNTKLFNGKPLFHYTLEKLNKCKFIDEIYLDSESESIFESAKYIPHKRLKRDFNLANNKTDGHKLFHNEALQVPDADIYIQILCTSPFIKVETIKKGVEIIEKANNYDSVVLVKSEKLYTWTDGKPNYDLQAIPNSFDIDDIVVETMGLYITNNKTAIERKRRFGEKPFLLEASKIESVDINYPEDFIFAEFIQKGLQEMENLHLNLIAKHLSSSILSDVLDNLNIKTTLPGFKLNIKGKKVFGKAKTLKIQKIENNEDSNGIYDALASYDSVCSNDIIVVQNSVPDYAYFGELNAHLALSKGASAAIIGGKTRDFLKVKNMDYPVFSKGYTPIDVKGRATLESINEEIEIDGVKIIPGDYIFGDCEGINIIPFEHFDKIIESALNIVFKENKIINDILNQLDISDILHENGPF